MNKRHAHTLKFSRTQFDLYDLTRARYSIAKYGNVCGNRMRRHSHKNKREKTYSIAEGKYE